MAYPFRVILSPIDFNDNSLAALDVARQMARDQGATIHLLHVVPSVLTPVEAEAAYGTQEHDTTERLEAIARERLGGIKHHVHACAGETDKEITRVAEELKADLIVLATHGRTGLTHFFLGSVAEKIVREAPCPVLSIRAPHA